jgi:hypothetical protein
MGWKPANIKQWSNVFRHWARCSIMEHDRINFKVFKWSIKKANGRINTTLKIYCAGNRHVFCFLQLTNPMLYWLI